MQCTRVLVGAALVAFGVGAEPTEAREPLPLHDGVERAALPTLSACAMATVLGDGVEREVVPTLSACAMATVLGDGVEGEVSPTLPTLFLIIDDVGNSIADLRVFLALDVPVTFAILPNLDNSVVAAEMIAKEGQQYILHIPMEPFDSTLTDPHAILVDDSDSLIHERVGGMLESVPNIRGVNNHMGSRATTDQRVMRVLFEVLSRRNLFFVNSLTAPNTVAEEIAREVGVSYLERHFFLDNVATDDAIAMVLRESVAHARVFGEAVLIGHVSVLETAAVLSRFIATEGSRAVKFDYIANHENIRD